MNPVLSCGVLSVWGFVLWGFVLDSYTVQGHVQDFRKGGPISLGSLKKGHQILKGGGGSNGLMGGVQYFGLTRTTNLAYLDAKE